MTTAAVPQANISVMRAVLHAGDDLVDRDRRFADLEAEIAGEHERASARVTPCRMVSVSGGVRSVLPWTNMMFMPPISSTYWWSRESRNSTCAQPSAFASSVIFSVPGVVRPGLHVAHPARAPTRTTDVADEHVDRARTFAGALEIPDPTAASG